MDKSAIINLIITVIGSGGIFGGIYTLLKLRPEAGQITVTAAQGALIVQTGVIDNLREEIVRLREDVARLTAENRTLWERVRSNEIRTTNIEKHSEVISNEFK